MVKSKRIGSFF